LVTDKPQKSTKEWDVLFMPFVARTNLELYHHAGGWQDGKYTIQLAQCATVYIEYIKTYKAQVVPV
jgi:hypothetical protein